MCSRVYEAARQTKDLQERESNNTDAIKWLITKQITFVVGNLLTDASLLRVYVCLSCDCFTRLRNRLPYRLDDCHIKLGHKCSTDYFNRSSFPRSLRLNGSDSNDEVAQTTCSSLNIDTRFLLHANFLRFLLLLVSIMWLHRIYVISCNQNAPVISALAAKSCTSCISIDVPYNYYVMQMAQPLSCLSAELVDQFLFAMQKIERST